MEPYRGARINFDIFEPATTLRDRQDAFRIVHIDHHTDMLAVYGFPEKVKKIRNRKKNFEKLKKKKLKKQKKSQK